MFPEDVEGEPKLEILEHPKSRGFRFRYTCEGPSHGGIPGASSDKNKKTFPAVRIVNYQGYARIVVQLVTNEENPRLHPHSLVGKQCQNGICTVQCGPKDMTATFPNLGIQHVTKKNVASILEERYIAAEMQLSSINDGFPQEVQRNIKDEDRKRIAAKAQSEAKSIDLSVVRLMFIAYLPDSQGAFTIMLKPIISEAIFDSKAPNAATLKICRMDCNAGSASGNDEVYLLCDKVQKDDIQVRFLEEDPHGREIWENYGSFCPTDVHRQFAIVFRTPPYKDQYITQPVNVNVQLRRKSDGEVSEPRTFTYLPNKTDFEMIERKRRKVMPDYIDQIGGNNSQGYNFTGSGTGGNSVQSSYQFEGSSGASNENVKKAALSPPAPLATNKKLNPQKGPVEPWILSGKPNPLHTQTQAQVKQEYLPGTSVPLPRDIKPLKQTFRAAQSYSAITPANQYNTPANQQFPVPMVPAGTSSITPMLNANTTAFSSNVFPSSLVSGQDVDGLTADVQAMFTDQFFATSSQTRAHLSQVTQTTSARTNFSGNASRLMTSLPNHRRQANGLSASVCTEDDIMTMFKDEYEPDGEVNENKEVEEHDFACVLYDCDDLTNMKESSEVKTPADQDVDGLECDSAYFTTSFQNLTLSESNDFVNQKKSEKVLNPKSECAENIQKVHDVAKAIEMFTCSYKEAEAKKMAAAMHEFAVTGNVRALLRQLGHLSSATDQNGDTVLHQAVINDQLEVLSSVLDVTLTLDNRDEILNRKNNDQQTALQIAVLSDNAEAVIELLKAGANPLVPDRNGNHSVHVASRHGSADILSRLLNSKHAKDRKFDTKNHNGLGCYHLSLKAKKDNQECLLLLRDHYCDVDCQDTRSGRTPLHMAVDMQDLTLVQTLTSECDADINVRSFDGYSPLHLAAASGHCEIASLLLAHGACPDAICDSSTEEIKTAADLAQTDEMRDVLNGKAQHFVPDNSSSHNKSVLFDRNLRNKFCELLNAEQSESGLFGLADRLQISDKLSPKFSNSAIASLLQTYWLSHGTVDGLRSALMNMGRHDAVQILNQCVNSTINQAWRNQENRIY